MRLLTALVLTAFLAGYAGAAEKAKAPEKDAWKKKVFTAEELAKYNGKDGQPVYVAVDGVVYDLSKSKYWKTGAHMKRHDSGADLSRELHEDAPKGIHKGGKVLNKMPKVGVTEAYGKKDQPPAKEKAAEKKIGK